MQLIRKYRVQLLIFCLSFLIYQLSFYSRGDTVGVTYLTMSLVQEGNFDLNEYAAQLIPQDQADNDELPYYLIKTEDDKLVSTFGIGVALLYTPPFLIKSMLSSKMNVDHMEEVDRFFKLVTSLLMAALLVVVYQILLLRDCPKFYAALLTCTLGFATNLWTICSTSLWQHGPSQLMLVLAVLFFYKAQKNALWASLAAIPLSLAVIIRPTSLIVALILFAFVMFNYRKQIPLFILLTAPFIFVLANYNYTYFGSIAGSGQLEASKAIAMAKIGTTDVWSGNLFQGISGILFSPSRGLFVYSPFFLFLFYGTKYRLPKSGLDIYLITSVLAILIIQSKWFDWWGGWTFGYRSILDIVPFLIILLSVNVEKIWKNYILRTTFATLLFISFCIQIIGVTKYNDKWNKEMQVDKNHEVLWSIPNAQLAHYITKINEDL